MLSRHLDPGGSPPPICILCAELQESGETELGGGGHQTQILTSALRQEQRDLGQGLSVCLGAWRLSQELLSRRPASQGQDPPDL